MIITRTPFRMSFMGGGTDFPDFFNEYGGSVISTTFDKYCYVNVRHLPRFFDYTTEITYSKVEKVCNVEDIEHPAIREAMKHHDMHELRLTYEADLPARSGLGTSSSFAVGMLNAFFALKGKYIGKEELAKEAIYLERILCKESGGWQDQIAVSYGGLNKIVFKNGNFTVHPVIISPERKSLLNNNLLLFFTGFSRFSFEIAEEQNHNIKNKIFELKEMNQLVDEGYKILTSKCNLNSFGHLLNSAWELKRGITKKVSSNSIDELYLKAINAGAIGGKLLGAGGGGFLLFYVERDKQKHVKEALKDLLYVPFRFEESGTSIIHYTPEVYTPINDHEVLSLEDKL